MRIAVAICGVILLCGSGCSKFAGEWVEEGTISRAGQFQKTEGPRRMALKFEPITVRAGSYVDPAGVVDNRAWTIDTYFTMKDGNVAQFGSTIAKVKGNRIVTIVGGEESRQYVRIKGPSIFPPVTEGG